MSELVILDESSVKRLKRAVGTDSELVIWIGDWLSHLNLFSDAQVYDILRFVKDKVEQFEIEIQNNLNPKRATLAICDSRWVSFTGIPKFLDTETTELEQEMDEFAVTHIICDVTALRARMKHRQGRFHAKSSSDSNTSELHEAKQQQPQ